MRDHALVLWKHPALEQADNVAKIRMRNSLFPGLLMVLAIVIVRLAVELGRVAKPNITSLQGALR